MGRSLEGQNLAALVKVKGDVTQILCICRCLHNVHLVAIVLGDNRGVVAAWRVRSRGIAAGEEEGVRMSANNDIDVRSTIGGDFEVNLQAGMGQDDNDVHPIRLQLGRLPAHCFRFVVESELARVCQCLWGLGCIFYHVTD